MKKMTIIFALCALFAETSFAGRVISLNPGETLPLSNGDVVACIGENNHPSYSGIKCDLFISGLPVFPGVGFSDSSAKEDARRSCREYMRDRPFVVGNKVVDICDDREAQIYAGGIYREYKCKPVR